MRLHRLVLAAVLLAGPPAAWAQTGPAADPLAPVRSMGMPPAWKPFTGGYSGVAGLNGGVRVLGELRGIFLKVGIDYDFQRQHTSTIISFTLPIRRSGIFGYGTHLRVDWLPDRGNSWAVGVQIPLEPHMGKTRPRDTDVAMPRAKKPPVRAAMDPGVAEAMREVRASSPS